MGCPQVRMYFPKVTSDVYSSYSRQPPKACLTHVCLKYSINITILNTFDPIYNSVFSREVYLSLKKDC